MTKRRELALIAARFFTDPQFRAAVEQKCWEMEQERTEGSK